jgi:hypothetical protein
MDNGNCLKCRELILQLGSFYKVLNPPAKRIRQLATFQTNWSHGRFPLIVSSPTRKLKSLKANKPHCFEEQVKVKVFQKPAALAAGSQTHKPNLQPILRRFILIAF